MHAIVRPVAEAMVISRLMRARFRRTSQLFREDSLISIRRCLRKKEKKEEKHLP